MFQHLSRWSRPSRTCRRSWLALIGYHQPDMAGSLRRVELLLVKLGDAAHAVKQTHMYSYYMINDLLEGIKEWAAATVGT
jgi:hypothetical protein